MEIIIYPETVEKEKEEQFIHRLTYIAIYSVD